MNGISVNTSENVADSQTRQRVGSELAWDTGEIKCDLCEFGTKNKFGLKIPFLKKHSTAKFKCLTCDFTSMSHSELVEHNDRCYYYHRITLIKDHEKQIFDEFQQLDEEGFIPHRKLDC